VIPMLKAKKHPRKCSKCSTSRDMEHLEPSPVALYGNVFSIGVTESPSKCSMSAPWPIGHTQRKAVQRGYGWQSAVRRVQVRTTARCRPDPNAPRYLTVPTALRRQQSADSAATSASFSITN
jgi:hypothetical protein